MELDNTSNPIVDNLPAIEETTQETTQDNVETNVQENVEPNVQHTKEELIEQQLKKYNDPNLTPEQIAKIAKDMESIKANGVITEETTEETNDEEQSQTFDEQGYKDEIAKLTERVNNLIKKSDSGDFKASDKPENYVVNEEYANSFKESEGTDIKDDMLYKTLQNKAVEFGLNKNQFDGLVSGILDHQYNEETIKHRETMNNEAMIENVKREYAELGNSAKPMLENVNNYGKELFNNGIIDKDDYEYYTTDLFRSTKALKLINKIQKSSNESRVPNNIDYTNVTQSNTGSYEADMMDAVRTQNMQERADKFDALEKKYRNN